MNEYYTPNVDKMYTYMKAFCRGANMELSLKALSFARDKHSGQLRKNGIPYIAHPLSMACYAESLGIRNDVIMATIFLHDVCEDCGIPFEQLPFPKEVQEGVRYVTITKFDTDLDKMETKRRYYSELRYNKPACITKAIDKYMNLSDMPFALSNDAIGKNAAETNILLLPILKEVQDTWYDVSNIIYTLRVNLRSMSDVLRKYNSEEYAKWAKIIKGEKL